jgi:formylglycine-generating enzyme required for sulfatase activity
MKMVLIPAGEFLMGSPESEKDRYEDEGPQHRVRITKSFYFGQYPVTLGQFLTFYHDANYKLEMERDRKGDYGYDDGKESEKRPWAPGFENGMDHPVLWVSWNDAVAFCEWLSKKEGKEYRLPTEAQWEYACRAGSTTRYYFGDSESELSDYAWYHANAGSKTHPVGEKKPNAWGLYDMQGNVWQWCADWYGGEYYAASPVDDPQGPDSGSLRVRRGGSWRFTAGFCRSAIRYSSSPGYRGDFLGLRVSLVPADK